MIATALFALWVTWLMDTTVGVPAALGADTTVAVCPIGSAVVAGVMAAVALLVRGRRSPAE
ncbi:MAG: hypothetical protein U0R64_01010 [Candidatus Nanopelagicales bacterium]